MNSKIIKNQQSGIGAIEIVLIVAVVLLIGTLIYNAGKNPRLGRGYQGYQLAALANTPNLPNLQLSNYLQGVYTGTLSNNYLGTTRSAYPNTYTETRTTATVPVVPTTTSTTYTYTNPSTVSTNTPPVITLYGDSPYRVFHRGSVAICQSDYYYNYTYPCPTNTTAYTEPGYRAYDKEDGDITNRVTVTNEGANNNMYPYNNYGSQCQSYTIRYTVTDSNGNSVTSRRTVNECYGQ